MEYENKRILVEICPGKIAKITLNNPPLNLMSHASTQELLDAMKKIRVDDEVRCVVLCGNGRAFSAGSNLNETTFNSQDPIANKMLRESLALNAFECFEKFTIAAIEGKALGGGMELAMACDMRVMSTAASAGFPEVNNGFRPGTACFRLPKLVGVGKALELLLTGLPIGAEECERIGLVNRVTPPGEALRAAMEIAGVVARKSPHSVKVIRDSVRSYGFKPTEECFWANLHHCEEIYEKDEWAEGVRSFFEKRKPEFLNR